MAAGLMWLLMIALGILSGWALVPGIPSREQAGPLLVLGLVLLYVLAGLLMLVSPRGTRSLLRGFLTPKPVRLMGVLVMILGAALFRVASHPSPTLWPLFFQVIGSLGFIKGGVQLLLPNFTIVVAEWWSDRGDSFLRAIGVLCIAFAVLVAYAGGALGKKPLPIEEEADTPGLTAPADEPTAEPAAAPDTEPTTEPAAAPAAEPTTEPTAEPTAEPAAEQPTASTSEQGSEASGVFASPSPGQ